MQGLEEKEVHCPYCGEAQVVLLDCSVEHQSYIEDCEVCCRPINFEVRVDYEGAVSVRLKHENE